MNLLSILLIIVVNYNVENLFHPKHDSVAGEPKEDIEWTAEGERHWSYTRYYRKEENIARVLTNIGEWDGVDVVGLQEVENALCVKRLCYTLRRGEYAFVHYESPDRRGIDVALIYKKSRIDTLCTRPISINISPETTRDILYVCARVNKRDTVHFFVCHFPSQRGGKAESEWKRKAVKDVLQQAVDSVFKIHAEAKIIVMGDMNEDGLQISGLEDKKMQGNGTHKYQGRWIFLDHFYVSPSIDSLSQARVYDAEWIMEPDDKYLGLKPKRTYNGYHYQNGYSDHLPIVLNINL
jgi:endonuclease/exonuclease/phosphatase family metal-dependent hydrolase